MSSILSTSEAAWQTYQDIERVIGKRYSNSYESRDVTQALQRLGEAVVHHHSLNTQDHPIQKRWNLQLQHPDQKTITLSTTEQMLGLRVVEWESAIPSMQAGHDVWTEGREEGFRPQKSLQQTLDRDYFEIKHIVDMTGEQASSVFKRIQQVTEVEMRRLEAKGGFSLEKKTQISNAVQRLESAVAHKYQMQLPQGSYVLSVEERKYVDSTDLYSFKTMLDAKIHTWSVRQACNLSTNSLFSRWFGLQESMWGQTATLRNIEENI